MTPQELKNSILQLAIQGKLVEQRPEEGIAEELYRQIQVEKQALIKAGKIKKEKPLPEITEDEIPFDIPESWKWVRLTDVAIKITDGTHHSPPNTERGEYMYVTAKNIKDYGIVLDNITYVSSKIHSDIYSRCDPEKGDVLLIKDGATTGVVTVNNLDEPFSMLSSVALIKVPDGLCAWYLVYVIRSDLFYKIIRAQMKGTGITRITLKQIEPLLIPLPPLAEQKRIVAKIEELLPLIDRYEKAWTRLEDFNKRFPGDMQKSILQMAIQGKLVEQRPEEGTGEELYQQIQKEKQALIKKGELRKTKSLPIITEDAFPYSFPDSWKVCYIDDIAFVTKLAGFEYTKYIAPNLSDNGIPLFKGKNVQNGKIVLDFESHIPESVSDELPRSQIQKKCLLTPYVGTIGNIAIFDGSFRAHLGSNVGKIELLNNSMPHVLEEYVLYYLRSIIGYSELTKFKKATAQESISIDAIRNVIIPLPPLAEQKRIVARLEELLPLCERLK